MTTQTDQTTALYLRVLANPDAYPQSAGFKSFDAAPAPAQPQKRHSFVMDTDPLLPPDDMTGKDPSMGVINIDSNHKPEDDVPKTAGKHYDAPTPVAVQDAPDVPAPVAKEAAKSTDAATPSPAV